MPFRWRREISRRYVPAEEEGMRNMTSHGAKLTIRSMCVRISASSIRNAPSSGSGFGSMRQASD